FQALKKDDPSNFICSPLGINFILSMLYFGARGTTKKLLETSLKLHKDENDILRGYQQLIDSLSNVKKTEMQLASKLFTLNEPRPEFKEIIESSLGSEAQCIDLTNTAEASDIINNWCASRTNNKITQIIEPDDLEDAQMVLVSAIHFKSSWKRPFNPKNTKNRIFYTSEETHVNVPTMFACKKFHWGPIPNLNATFIKLPFKNTIKNDALSMYIIRPDDINGLRNGGSIFDNIDFNLLRGEFGKVLLNLPKFKIESMLNLELVLTKMGMSEIFGEGANFTGINNQSNLHVSNIIQKVFINVDELGSEAAAVTVARLSARFYVEYVKPKPFIVDRPFVYLIVHTITNTVLFQGQVYNPIET
ncbi:ovalbumin-related protein X-like, partial [Cotesia glomerata]|uniref:ovalbumin-related protein X-like n=1 Tax=Cotesia glomerata TaxID=32391 RepID=UPI001D022934